MAIRIVFPSDCLLPEKLSVEVKTSAEYSMVYGGNHNPMFSLLLKRDHKLSVSKFVFKLADGREVESELSTVEHVYVELALKEDIRAFSFSKSDDLAQLMPGVSVDSGLELEQSVVEFSVYQGDQVCFDSWVPIYRDWSKELLAHDVERIYFQKQNGEIQLCVLSADAQLQAFDTEPYRDGTRFPCQLYMSPCYGKLITKRDGLYFHHSDVSKAVLLSREKDWLSISSHPFGFLGVNYLTKTGDPNREIWLNGAQLLYQGTYRQLLSSPSGDIYLLTGEGNLIKYVLN